MSKLIFGLSALSAINSAIDSVFSSVPNITTFVRDVAATDSLVSFTQGGRVEPITIIDQECLSFDALHDTLQSLQAVFTGYYLQAVSYTGKVDGVSVLNVLDQFNPARDPIGHVLSRNATESFNHRLPNYDELGTRWSPSMEARNDESTAGGNNLDNLTREATNLSVGRLVNVTISRDSKCITVPVSIRLMANIADSETTSHILSIGNVDNSFSERIHGWRSGRLDFWNDLVMASDLIEAHRKNLIRDKSGIYAEIMNRRAKNAASAAVTKRMSVATASNLVVVSKSTVEATEARVGGEFKNFKFRERIFDQTYMMIMAVIDPQWQNVTFYTRGIALPTVLTFRELKAANKGAGPDIFSIFKALEAGAAVKF